MLKIFTTQLFGLFKEIQEKEEFSIEDGSRILAQTIISNGTIYFYGTDALEGICSEAVKSSESLRKTTILLPEVIDHIFPLDSIVFFAKDGNEPSIQTLIQTMKNKPKIIGISNNKTSFLANHADAHICTHVKNGLIPNEDGTRKAHPHFITTLYCYYALWLNTKEILEEY